MRPNRIAAGNEFLHSTLVVACATGIGLSGCLGGSSRDLSADLGKDAQRSALQAEAELAARKKAALAEQPEAAELAGTTSDVVQVGAESSSKEADSRSTRKNPLAALLRFGRRDEVEAEDPFLSDDSSAAVATAVPRATANRDASVETPATAKTSVEEILGVDTRDGASLGEATPLDNVDVWDAMISQSSRRVLPEATAATKESARPFPGAMPKPAEPAAQPKVAEIDEPVLEATGIKHPVAETVASAPAKETERRVSFEQWAQQAAAATAPQAAPKPAAKKVLPGGVDEAQLRVQALISQAHSHYRRGELHAAYRSAVLARELAKSRNVTLDDGAEAPAQLVAKIAEELWGTPSEKDAVPVVRAAQSKQPTAPEKEPKQEKPAPASVNAAFPGEGFAQWRALPEIRPAGHASESEGEAKAKVAPTEIPDLREGDAQDAAEEPKSADEAPAEPADNETAMGAPRLGEAPPWAASGTTAGQAQVKEAPKHELTMATLPRQSGISHAVAENQQASRPALLAPATGPALPAPFPAPTSESTPKPLTVASAESPAPVETSSTRQLTAPLPPAEPVFDGGPVLDELQDAELPLLAEPSLPPSTPSRAEESETDRSSLRWGLAGFAAAVVSTVVGLRLRRAHGETEATS